MVVNGQYVGDGNSVEPLDVKFSGGHFLVTVARYTS